MGRVTLAEVSKHAGVSRSTASLVLNDSPTIPDSTKVRVRESMVQLGYVYNRQAAMLRNQRSMTLGLIVTEVRNAYFGEIVMSVEEAAYEAGYTVLVCYSRDEAARQDTQFRRLLERGIDGLIVQPAADTDPAQIDAMRKAAGVPLVLLARHFGLAHDYVGANNRLAGEIVGRHLVEIGARTVAMVGGPASTSTSRERWAGLHDAASGTALTFAPTERIPSLTHAAGGAEATASLLEHGALPDAIIAFSDVIASGVYAELHARGLQPGVDIAVASFDDLPGSDHYVPPLTTVATFPKDIGSASARVLLHRLDSTLDGDAIEHVLVEPELRVRASTTLWRRSHL